MLPAPGRDLVKWAAADWISQAAHTCCHPVKALPRVAPSPAQVGAHTHTRTRGTDTWRNGRRTPRNVLKYSLQDWLLRGSCVNAPDYRVVRPETSMTSCTSPNDQRQHLFPSPLPWGSLFIHLENPTVPTFLRLTCSLGAPCTSGHPPSRKALPTSKPYLSNQVPSP